MVSFGWDCLFCCFPLLLLFLWLVALRWPRVHCWWRQAVRASSWSLWVIVCLILDLPLRRNTTTCTKGAKPSDTADILSGFGRNPDGARFICKATALARHVQQHCSSLNASNLASWPRGDPHLQTVSGQLCGRSGDPVPFTRENLLLKDGGMVALDWAVGTRHDDGGVRKRLEPLREHQPGRKGLGCFTQNPPVLLLIPQSWGGMTPHLKLLSRGAMRQGFYVVVFHHRGTAGSPLCTARLTEFGDPSDLEEAVAYVHSRRPSSALFAVSEGSGSGVLLSYLGESGSSSHLTAAAAISPVLLGQLWFETLMPPIYRWGALFHRKQQLSRYENSFRGIVDVDRALISSSLKEFEESLFCASAQHQQQQSPLKGLAPSLAWSLGERAYPAKDWEGYWGRNEPLRDADEVAVPVLCVCSRDDPILPPASTLPLSLFLSNPYFLLVLSDRGGHCGFTQEEVSEEEGGGRWSHTLALEYFRVVADFLQYEENWSWRRPLGGGPSVQGRTEAMAVPRRRRTNVMRRTKVQSTENSGDAERGAFTWKRSYTR